MKKLLFVNNNMQIGGVQKSLYNLLWEIHNQYDITLCLFSPTGAYLEQLPDNVKVITCGGLFRYLGVSQGECCGAEKLIRGVLAALCRLLGRDTVLRLMLPFQKAVPGHFDLAVSFLHNGRAKAFYGGVQEFVLYKTDADSRIAFLHGDYTQCGGNYDGNNRTLTRFDWIAACSDGCRRILSACQPTLAEQCVTVRNCHRYDEILASAEDHPAIYDHHNINIVMVSRLSHEKAIDRAINAVAACRQQGLPAALHIVGGGPMRSNLENAAKQRGIAEYVHFYGEQTNPYRYMKNADLFLLTSYHEAAPMVIDEAVCLALPVLTTKTTSSAEMVEKSGAGWVCENSQDAITEALIQLLRNPQQLTNVKHRLQQQTIDNSAAAAQFAALTEGFHA